jgi:hypothetical protein
VGFKIQTLANDVNDELEEVAAAGVKSKRPMVPSERVQEVNPNNDPSPISPPSATGNSPELTERPEVRVPVREPRRWGDRSSPFDSVFEEITSEIGFAEERRPDISQ